MKNNLEAIAGAGGSYLLKDTTPFVRNFINAVVMSDCVISSITDSNGRVMSAYNFASSTLTEGTIITCQGDFFTSVALTSGSIMLYLK